MRSKHKSGRAFAVSIFVHIIAGIVGFFFWPNSDLRLDEGAVNAVLMKVEKPRVKRMSRPKRARIRNRTETNITTNQPNLKILTSNAPVTQRGVVSAAAPTKLGDVGSLDFSGGNLTTNTVRIAPPVRKTANSPVKTAPVEEGRPKSRLVKFIEKQPNPQQIIYCVDLSSSMLGLKPRKLKKIIAILQDSLAFLELHDQFNIMTFSREVEFYQPNFLAVTDENVSSAIAYLEAAKPRKSPRYVDKDMFEALHDANKIQPTIIVLFSDGILTSGFPDIKAVEKQIGGKTKIFAMATEMAEDFPGAVLLKMLADTSRGEFWLVKKPQLLPPFKG
ncbi:MAG: VWA domain-containing protein [Candidatus Poribacteria bacterium]|nr:VWA domain-containing protein [Candidatus Poribacteria bacterium]